MLYELSKNQVVECLISNLEKENALQWVEYNSQKKHLNIYVDKSIYVNFGLGKIEISMVESEGFSFYIDTDGSVKMALLDNIGNTKVTFESSMLIFPQIIIMDY